MTCSLTGAWRAAIPATSVRSIQTLSNSSGKKRRSEFPENGSNPGNWFLHNEKQGTVAKPGNRRSLHSPSSPRPGYEHLPGWQTTPWGTKRADTLQEQYDEAIAYQKSKRLPPDVNKRAVFANTELNLDEIEVYGFDYDYTLATYKEAVEEFIYQEAKKALVYKYKYPKPILDIEYDPQGVIRGLHYDIPKGLLLKLDSINQIQLGTVYRGRMRLSDEEVKQIYGRAKIPQAYVDSGLRKGPQFAKMVQLIDIFAKPMICLLRELVQWFEDQDIKVTPESIFVDVQDSIDIAHPLFHQIVKEDPARFLDNSYPLLEYLDKLKSAGKTCFLITNSPYALVNAGMGHLVGSKWRSIFDVIIVNAKKPAFFTHRLRHIREYRPEKKTLSWRQPEKLIPGKIYSRGNMAELCEMTGWEGQKVLYFGDHPYADLADLSLNFGWRTGALIQELDHEINVLNTPEFKWGINWSTTLQHMIEDNQHRGDWEDKAIIKEWKEELRAVRHELKVSCNPHFGSIFRTHRNSSFFSRRLFRFADIYTSNLTNMGGYSLEHTFYPRRGALPHEFRSWFV